MRNAIRHILPLIIFALFGVLFGCANKTDLGDDAAESFIKYYGNTGIDEGFKILNHPDGGYVLFGSVTTPDNGKDMTLIRVDQNGNLQWQKTYGGSLDDTGRAINILDNGGEAYYVLGGTFRVAPDGADNALDGYVVWANKNGDLLSEVFLNIDNSNEEVYDLAIDEIGIDTVAIIGYTDAARDSAFVEGDPDNMAGFKDVLFARLTRSGIVENPIPFGFDGNDIGYSIKQIPMGFSPLPNGLEPGDFLMVGQRQKGSGPLEIFWGRADRTESDVISIGATEYNEGFLTSNDNVAKALELAPSGQVLFTGNTSTGNSSQGYLVSAEFQSGGQLEGPVSFFQSGGSTLGEGLDYSDGIVAVSGSVFTGGAQLDDYLLATYTPDASLRWEQVYGGTGEERAFSVVITPDGGYALIGVNEFEGNPLIQFLRTNPQGIIGE